MSVDIRAIAVTAMDITAITDIVPKERWGQFASFDDPQEHPFLVIKLGEEAPEPNWRLGPCQQQMQVWIHDTPGDFGKIDTLVRLIKAAFLGVNAQQDLVEVRYAYTSPDLEDDQLGTIVRYSTYQWTLARGEA